MLYGILLALLIIDSIVLTAVVLMQAGQGGGLAALGGSGGTESFFGGRHAVTALTKMTWWCGGIFLGLSLILAGLSTRGTAPRSVLEGEINQPAPVAPIPLNPGVSDQAGDDGGSQAPAEPEQ